MKVGKVTFVGSGPGAADLITVRGVRALQRATAVLYDNLIDRELLDETSGTLHYVGKRCGHHSMPQHEINALLVECAREGHDVVRLKGGDPSVFGRVGEEMLAVAAAGIPFEVVPGITSSVAAPELANIPVTHRGIADSFCVATAHRKGDAVDFSVPAYSERRTVVLLMGVTTRARWQAELLEAGYPPDLPVAWVSRAAREDQNVLVTTLGEMLDDSEDVVESPAVAVIGHVVTLRAQLAELAAGARHAQPGQAASAQ